MIPPSDQRAATRSIARTLTQDDFDRFAALSGDNNPIHVDPEFSARTRFGRTVSHGVLLCSILRGLAGEVLPGARQVGQAIRFPAPTFAGEPMGFAVRLDRVADGIADLSVSVSRIADGTVTCDGTMSFALPDDDLPDDDLPEATPAPESLP